MPERQDPEGETVITPPCTPQPTYAVTLSLAGSELIDFECPGAALETTVETLGEARVSFEQQSHDPLAVLLFAERGGTPTEVRLTFLRAGEEVAATLMTLEVSP